MNMTDMFWVATQLCWWVTRAAISNEMAMTWKLYCTQKFARLGPIIPFVAGIVVVCLGDLALACVLVTRERSVLSATDVGSHRASPQLFVLSELAYARVFWPQCELAAVRH